MIKNRPPTETGDNHCLLNGSVAETKGSAGQLSLFGDTVDEVLGLIQSILDRGSSSASQVDRERIAEGLVNLGKTCAGDRDADPSPSTTTETVAVIRKALDRWEPADVEDRQDMAGHLRNMEVLIVNGGNTATGPDLPLDYVEKIDGRHWDEIEMEFIQMWHDCDGVVKSSYQAMPSNLKAKFRDRWREDGWPDRAKEAMAKFPLKNGVKMSMRKFFEPTTVDEIIGGVHDFDPESRSRKKSVGEHNRETMSRLFEKYGESSLDGSLFLKPLAEVG